MAASTLASTSTTTTSRKHCTLSISIISVPKCTNFQLPKWNPQLGICKFATWNGLKHQGVPNSRYIVKIERRGRCRGKGVYASLFGVGAPEALVIGVVALLVFGPKGLAEVARNIGKTIRAFQPTIQELQEVSREFKNTLEREIGLDEIEDTSKTTLDSSSTAASVDAEKDIQPNGSPSSSNASPTEERITTAKEQLEALATQQQKEMASAEGPVETKGQSEVADSSPSATNDNSVQEYLKKLEEEWKALNSEKQKKMASAATVAKSQDSQEAASETPLPQKPESEDHIEMAKEQLVSSVSQQQKETASTESLVESEGQAQDKSPFATEEDLNQEYLKKLEREWEALNSEKQKKMASAATEVKSQVSESQEAVSVTPLPQKSESEDQIKTAERQLETSTVDQRKETATAESPVEPHGQSEAADSSPSSTNEDSIQEYLTKLEKEWEALNSEKQKKMASAATEMKTQDTQEAASVAPLSQKLENEDQMSEKFHDEDRINVEHQLL